VKKALLSVLILASFSIALNAQGAKKDTMTPTTDMSQAIDPAKAVFDLSGMGPGVVPYASEEASQALAMGKRVIYYFAASWCPTCRSTYQDLKANAANVPMDLAIVVVDYDI